MREIKFRGRHIDTGEWVYGNLIGTDVIVGPIVEWNNEYFNTEYWVKVDPKTVGQFSGVHDDDEDNLSELFQGDIIEVEIEGKPMRFKVEYEPPGFMIVSDSLDDGYKWFSDIVEFDTDYTWIPGSKKIGNIYENSFLLENMANN